MPQAARTELSLQQNRTALSKLGEVFVALAAGDPWPGHASGTTQAEYDAFVSVIHGAFHRNGWFTEENVRHALRAWSIALEPKSLEQWLAAYPVLEQQRPMRTIGLIMAGNIPLVGLHDLISVLLAGYQVRVKCASDDAGLTPAVVALLAAWAPDLAERITLVTGKLGDVDAVIATGSDNTARYFKHYFGHLPHIVRRNRTSVAVLDGTESEQELAALGEDLFRYFGLGCRNVGKVFLPNDFDLDRLFKAIFPWKALVEHGKYANNYDYHKALWLLDGVSLIENGFLLVKEDTDLHSPVGSLYIERYTDPAALEQRLAADDQRIQCVVGHGHVPFGEAQSPALSDYADRVDTMAFLLSL